MAFFEFRDEWNVNRLFPFNWGRKPGSQLTIKIFWCLNLIGWAGHLNQRWQLSEPQKGRFVSFYIFNNKTCLCARSSVCYFVRRSIWQSLLIFFFLPHLSSSICAFRRPSHFMSFCEHFWVSTTSLWVYSTACLPARPSACLLFEGLSLSLSLPLRRSWLFQLGRKLFNCKKRP